MKRSSHAHTFPFVRLYGNFGLPRRLLHRVFHPFHADPCTDPSTDTTIHHLRAVAITDDLGRYSFTTIRPGPYPGTGDPEHIHLHVDAAVHAHTYITFWFDDDPLVTDAKRRSLDRETVIVERQRDAQGTWSFTHDIRLKGS
ncbi:MAG: hypothetical protein KGS45_00180 [Planctomycetes bacterium]|nr:hypothetical protein [Planctomycetota bacterium]